MMNIRIVKVAPNSLFPFWSNFSVQTPILISYLIKSFPPFRLIYVFCAFELIIETIVIFCVFSIEGNHILNLLEIWIC